MLRVFLRAALIWYNLCCAEEVCFPLSYGGGGWGHGDTDLVCHRSLLARVVVERLGAFLGAQRDLIGHHWCILSHLIAVELFAPLLGLPEPSDERAWRRYLRHLVTLAGWFAPWRLLAERHCCQSVVAISLSTDRHLRDAVVKIDIDERCRFLACDRRVHCYLRLLYSLTLGIGSSLLENGI